MPWTCRSHYFVYYSSRFDEKTIDGDGWYGNGMLLLVSDAALKDKKSGSRFRTEQQLMDER